MNKISVIMLTYNREELVARMIDQILAQTFTDYEFIIVDNGSTDGSGAIADSYAKKDGRIRVIHRACGNIGSGRNAGLDAAFGEYIAFVDDDDECKADYLQFLYDLIVDHDADISICGATWSDMDEKLIMTSEEAVATLLWRKRYNVAFPTKMVKRKLFEHNRFLETGKYDDIYLMPRILADANRIAYHGVSKYHFNRHEGNNSAWTQNHKLLDAQTLQEYLTVYQVRTQWLSKRFPNSADKWRYFNWSFMLSMIEKITRYTLDDCREIQSELIAEILTHKDEFVNGGYLQDYERECLSMQVFAPSKREGVIYERFCFPVTLCCNLRCKLCAEHAPYAKTPYHPTFQELTRQLDRLFQLVQRIDQFDITGGEPFLREDLAEIVAYLYDHYRTQIGQVRVTTNGTLLPQKGFIDAAGLWKGDIDIIVDEYAVSHEGEGIARLLKAADIPFELRNYSTNLHCDGWVDYGDLTPKHNREEAKELFKTCMIPKLGFFSCMVNGRIFPCAKARLLYERFMVDVSVDLFDVALTENGKKERMNRLLGDEIIEACKYCNGLCETGPRFLPAEQLSVTKEQAQKMMEYDDWQLKYGKILIYTQTYNNENTIARTIESVLSQTNQDYTYFILNNGATDGTGDRIRRYTEANAHIVYAQCERNDILAATFMPFCLFAYIPEYLNNYYCIVDGDDTIEPNFIEEAMHMLSQGDPAMIVPAFNRINAENGELMNRRCLPEDRVVSGRGKTENFMALRPLLLCQWGKLYRWKLFKKAQNILLVSADTKLPMWFHQLDTVGVLSMFYQCEDVGFISSPVYNYYVSEQSTYGTYLPNRIENDVFMFHIYNDFLEKFEPVQQVNRDYCYAIYLSLLYETLNSIVNAKAITQEQKLSDIKDILCAEETKKMLRGEFDPMFHNLANRQDFLKKIRTYLKAVPAAARYCHDINAIISELNQYGDYRIDGRVNE